MNLRDIRRSAIEPALLLLPAKMESPQAIVMLLAITRQEDPEQRRRQWPTGPARSLWQAEQGGGMITGLLTYRIQSVRDLAAGLCVGRGVPPAAPDVWEAIEHDDILAAGLARLLLYTDPFRLPELGKESAAWDLYLRTWRPGAYDKGTPAKRAELRKKWAVNYAAALEAVQ
ncbi:hypothetical protein JVX91_00490 [Pseudomonas sp. PDNC002]|uniref:hypothetical protein n=1 Tax=Pseudomonas sp. PDNC002 TaxID=2811422 RepID=UPI001966CCF9|nr:hypothetical protein [Pseudomonas sp. PDNC002]QRY79625.1 hypothetical protein JVX91_00490 [Pseudomonas sp. PDNC002]